MCTCSNQILCVDVFCVSCVVCVSSFRLVHRSRVSVFIALLCVCPKERSKTIQKCEHVFANGPMCVCGPVVRLLYSSNAALEENGCLSAVWV
jgi:hypothetical protein